MRLSGLATAGWRGCRAIGGWLLPATCLVCGARGERDRDLCTLCANQLAVNRCGCTRCAIPLPEPATECGRCLRRPPDFDSALAPLIYGFPVDRLLQRFKFHGDLAAGRLLAATLLSAASAAPGARPATLIPVPLHRTRLRERGYNQALELARPISRQLGIPLAPDALERVRPTRAQSELGALDRRRNVRGAFAVRGRTLPDHVALVDDVMTTGATLSECARVLKRAGVARVDVWVVARAP